MKYLKLIVALVGMMSLSALYASAQEQQSLTIEVEEKVIPLKADFNALSVANDFEVTLLQGDCNLKLIVDNNLIEYVRTDIEPATKTLKISFDDKLVPKDVKKIYKEKNAPKPTFKVVVTMPDIAAISLSDNAVLNSEVEAFPSNIVRINITDKARLGKLSVSGNSAFLGMTKNAQASNLVLAASERVEVSNDGNATITAFTAATSNLAVNAAGNAGISVKAESALSNVNLNGNAKLRFEATCENVSAKALGNAKITFTGAISKSLLITGEKNGEFEADGLMVPDVVANLSGNSKAYVNPTGSLDVTLVGGSTLLYGGTPVIKVGKILKSTLAPKGTALK